MSISITSSPASAALLTKRENWTGSAGPPPSLLIRLQPSLPRVRVFAGNASPLDTDLSNELDAVLSFSEIVPDTVVFDDFERHDGIHDLFHFFKIDISVIFRSIGGVLEDLIGSIQIASKDVAISLRFWPDLLAATPSMASKDKEKIMFFPIIDRLSCFYNKALVNMGADLARFVPGRVSTEVDARLAYDTQGIIRKVHELLKLYNELEVSSQGLLFKIPSTWQGIEASRLLELEGIQTHLTFVYRVLADILA
ncbi:hypothetical protein OPV22_017550 [Ensete ventricosum]|uniref:Transaldolase n=1 Tax=Ensete ventricosum TaxID=4639 RepID=A0AAV8PFB9_ENSVE|nr:hypothetical protein OPV22_017550 [Ensete ventricosum]